MKNKCNWIIHYVANGYCETCKRYEEHFLPYMCNAHTHGMKRYKHPDFQIVLDLGPEDIGYILNEFGRRVQEGKRFHSGDMVSGIFTDCDVMLESFYETGRKVLRVIIPDSANRFPENPTCEEIYALQLKETKDLYRKGE